MIPSDNSFLFAGNLSSLPDPGQLVVELAERLVVLVRIGKEVFCIDDVCTHDGGTLSDGELEDGCLVCPRHGARFDVRTGNPMCMPATEPTQTHEVRLDGDRILVRLNDRQPGAS